MSLTNCAIFKFPNCLTDLSVPVSQSAPQFDGVGDGFGFVLYPPKAGTIDSVTFATNTGQFTPNMTVRAGIYNVDSSTPALPNTASLFGGCVAGTRASANWTDGVYTITFGTGCTIASGDLGTLIAVILDVTVRTSGQFRLTNYGVASDITFPYGVANTTGTWGKLSSPGRYMSIVLNYHDGTVAYIPGSMDGFTSYTIGTGTTPDEVGLKITIPVKCRVIGASFNTGGLLKGVNINLYDNSGTRVAQKVIGDTAAASVGNTINILFASPVTLNGGDVIRLSLEASSASTQSVNKITPTITNMLSQMIGPSVVNSTAIATSRSDAGSWTDDATSFFPFNLLIDQIDPAAQGGGLLVHPGTSGGMRA